ncbi:MAG: hypothetical protein M3552_01280, partial [Planctomycetota bacterium]|nr:hypothetical protein [Planctomycetota bacterium]
MRCDAGVDRVDHPVLLLRCQAGLEIQPFRKPVDYDPVHGLVVEFVSVLKSRLRGRSEPDRARLPAAEENSLPADLFPIDEQERPLVDRADGPERGESAYHAERGAERDPEQLRQPNAVEQKFGGDDRRQRPCSHVPDRDEKDSAGG